MNERRVTASPYRIGSSVSSVELLLEARTAAEGALPLFGQQLSGGTRVSGPFEVTGVVPGPAEWDTAMRFVAEARSGVLGALLVEQATVVQIADLIIGGRGRAEDREPSPLEVELFAGRMLTPVATILDAVAPGRPEPVALIDRDYAAPARSLIVELAVTHGDDTVRALVEVLAHHIADDRGELDSSTMEHICEDVPLEMTFTFTPVHLQAHEVAALQPGDVICLEHGTDKPLLGEVGGQALVTGRVGVSRRHAAIEVVELVERSR